MPEEKPRPMTNSDVSALKKKSVRGGIVTMIAQAVTIAVQLISTVVLARLLSPEDYGVMAMVMAVTAFAGLFREMGLSTAAIQKKDLTRGQQSNLFWLNVAMGCVLTLLVALGSPLVAWFYKKPELASVTLVLSCNFLIGSLATQHGAMLVRNMQFGRRSVATISGSVVTLAVAVVLALQGRGYWALVWGILAGGTITTILTVVLAPFRPGRPSRGQGIREMLGFGANVTAFNFVNYFQRNLDNILIGRYCGAESLGYYSRAYQLLMFPIAAIRGPVTAVAFPAMSRLQDNPLEYRQYYKDLVLLLSYMTMPIVAFLFVCSEGVIELSLGKQWLDVAPIFSVLAVTALIQTPFSLSGLVQLSLGRSQRYFRIGLASTVLTAIGFCIGVSWGAIGVASAYAITTYLRLIPILKWGFKDTPLRLSDFFYSISRPLFASLISALILYMLMWNVNALSLVAGLTWGALFFSASYIICIALSKKGRSDMSWLFMNIKIFIKKRGV